MRLLLDSHIFLWYITGDDRLTPRAGTAIRERSNEVFLSVVSTWEILLKFRLGKLALPGPPLEYLSARREMHGIRSLPLDEPSLAHLVGLELHHRDPFDRMLICQALHHDLTIVTADAQFRRYPITLLAGL